ncbi:MAG: hypothetical protein OXS29_16700 [bacterium]|nr:hypothetical protein [bacterium]MDE0289028.1 hypothetical protein [bacterium]MDE0437012.1 hypothetical protein [bacterium]
MTRQPVVDDVATGTVTVAEGRLDEAVRAYRHLFGYEVRHEGRLGEQLALTWGISDPNRSVVVLGAEGEERGLVRFVTGPTPPPAPYGSRGWTALEITVQDVDSLTERVRSSGYFHVHGEASDFGFGGLPPAIRASQAIGPAGEQVYLTQVLATGTSHVRPPPGCDVGALFVAVLLCTDPDEQLEPYVSGLGMNPAWRFEAAVEVISKQAGLPLDHEYEFIVLAPRGRTRVEVDRFPPDRPARKHPGGELPPGFGLLSFYTSDFDAAVTGMRGAGYPPVGPISTVDTPPYGGGRCAVFTGELGEKIELIESLTKETP